MKKIRLSSILVITFMFFAVNMNAQKGTDEAIKNLKAYDKVQLREEMERYVIYLDKKADESQFSVELIAGKTMEVDCNIHRLLGNFEEKTVEGWGYNYYVFETDGHAVSTLMACLDKQKTEKFITTGEGLDVRYNSRLPIVVYLPKDYDLKYRIWSAGDSFDAKKQ